MSSDSEGSLLARRGVLAALALTPVAAVSLAIACHQGTRRSFFFNCTALPAIAHYRLVSWMTKTLSKEEQEKRLEPLHEKYSQLALGVIRELRGYYIKIGQVLSARPDFVPQAYVVRMETLQDDCPHEDVDSVKALIAKSLGRPFEEVFEWIEDSPLGSASIGQVHKAKLRDGRMVAVKVQYPQVERLFRGDMATMRSFCRIVAPEQVAALDEVERSFLTEFDYAAALAEVSENVRRSPFRGRIEVPRPLPELCSKNVLVMEYLPGKKLADGLREQFAALLEKEKVCDTGKGDGSAQASRPNFGSGANLKMATDGLKAPPAWQFELFKVALKARDLGENGARLLRNCGATVVRQRHVPYQWHKTPPNPAAIVHLLTRVHAHQIFWDGLFNGDCHPGNVLLLDNGRLGLIDYGQARRLSVKQRLDLARIVVALADGKRDEVIRRFRDMGFKSKRNSDDVAFASACVCFDRDDSGVSGGQDAQTFFTRLHEEDPADALPNEFLMVARNSLLLRGLAIVLGIQLSVAKEWRKTAADFIRKHGGAGDDLDAVSEHHHDRH